MADTGFATDVDVPFRLDEISDRKALEIADVQMSAIIAQQGPYPVEWTYKDT